MWVVRGWKVAWVGGIYKVGVIIADREVAECGQWMVCKGVCSIVRCLYMFILLVGGKMVCNHSYYDFLIFSQYSLKLNSMYCIDLIFMIITLCFRFEQKIKDALNLQENRLTNDHMLAMNALKKEMQVCRFYGVID